MGRGSGGTLQLAPPFNFEGVTMRTFPLRARLPKLAKFIDSYLNMLPDEVGYFRPFIPYVYLMIINYGKMAVEAANMGWISQNEIAFSIPLEWYKRVNGVLKFHDFAYVSPFIYVDNDLSMTTGREVYGWPKSLVSLTAETSTWMENPRRSSRLATVSAEVFPRLYQGARPEVRPLLQIEVEPVPSLSRMPLDLSSRIFPWNSLPMAIRGSAAMLGDLGEILEGLGLTRRQEGANPRSLVEKAALLARNLNPYDPKPYFNTINLKQFRAAEVPGAFCYQSVTNAPMKLTKVNSGGLLGDDAMLFGDATGGYRILIHQWPTHPIVEGLGLEVAREWAGDGVEVAELRPVCPLWMDVDMHYELGETLAWRTRQRQSWTVPPRGDQAATTIAAEPEEQVDAPEPVVPVAAGVATPDPEHGVSRFNTSLGTSLDLTGPFDFPSTTLRVLPLLANKDKLRAFCNGYLNDQLGPTGESFEPWGEYVYLVATSYEEMSSDSNNIGSWADNDVVFYVPVKWYQVVEGKKKLRTVAMLPVFAFADGVTVAITRSEVTGIPTQKAEIISPPNTWMTDKGPSAGTAHKLLELRAQVLPVVGMGQPAAERTLIEIQEHDDVLPYNAEARWRLVAEKWGQQILKELEQKQALHQDHPLEIADIKALAVALLTGQTAFRIVTFKQFRDAEHPEMACYQSLNEISRKIDRLYDIREIDERMVVRIHRYDNCPIVASLGLVPKWTDFSGAAPVDSFQPLRPFWMKVGMREELGCRVLWRADQKAWVRDKHVKDEKSIFSSDPRSQLVPDVGRTLVAQIDEGRPRRLQDHVARWSATPGAERVTPEQALRAVETIGPTHAIECILANEWENWGAALWADAYSEIAYRLDRASVGQPSSKIASCELKVAKGIVEDFDALFTTNRGAILDETRAVLVVGQEMLKYEDVVVSVYEQLEEVRKSRGVLDLESPEVAALLAKVEAEHDSLVAIFGDTWVEGFRNPKSDNPLSSLLAVARALWEGGRESSMVKLSKAAQRPEFFVRRDSLGTESGSRMPEDQCRGPERMWFVGKSPSSGAPPMSRMATVNGPPSIRSSHTNRSRRAK